MDTKNVERIRGAETGEKVNELLSEGWELLKIFRDKFILGKEREIEDVGRINIDKIAQS